MCVAVQDLCPIPDLDTIAHKGHVLAAVLS